MDLPIRPPNKKYVYRVGGGISAPRAIYSPDAKYTEAARKAGIQGAVVVRTIVKADGSLTDIKIQKSLSPDLDQNALNTLRDWRFEPAMKDGRPVSVVINIELTFRLAH